MLRQLAIILGTSALAFGAFAKTTSSSDKPTLLSTTAPEWSPKLDGVSAVVSYDFADQVKVGGDKLDTEKSLILGAQYEFAQFYPGVSWQVGGMYEFKKEIDKTDGIKYQLWTAVAEVVGQLTDKVKVFGGVNYNRPSLSNLPGFKLKGDIGYQAGASYEINKNFAMDVRYRIVNMKLTGTNEFGEGVSEKTKSEGLLFSGRYMF